MAAQEAASDVSNLLSVPRGQERLGTVLILDAGLVAYKRSPTSLKLSPSSLLLAFPV